MIEECVNDSKNWQKLALKQELVLILALGYEEEQYIKWVVLINTFSNKQAD